MPAPIRPVVFKITSIPFVTFAGNSLDNATATFTVTCVADRVEEFNRKHYCKANFVLHHTDLTSIAFVGDDSGSFDGADHKVYCSQMKNYDSYWGWEEDVKGFYNNSFNVLGTLYTTSFSAASNISSKTDTLTFTVDYQDLVYGATPTSVNAYGVPTYNMNIWTEGTIYSKNADNTNPVSWLREHNESADVLNFDFDGLPGPNVNNVIEITQAVSLSAIDVDSKECILTFSFNNPWSAVNASLGLVITEITNLTDVDNFSLLPEFNNYNNTYPSTPYHFVSDAGDSLNYMQPINEPNGLVYSAMNDGAASFYLDLSDFSGQSIAIAVIARTSNAAQPVLFGGSSDGLLDNSEITKFVPEEIILTFNGVPANDNTISFDDIPLTLNDLPGDSTVYGCMNPDATNYDPLATVDNGSCTIFGCTDSNATNYNASATHSDGSCVFNIDGCMDSAALNYNELATSDDGSCIYNVYGCMDVDANNYNPEANTDDNSCTYDTLGCMDPVADNYNPAANVDDGFCTYTVYGCTDSAYLEYDENANTDDGTCSTFIVEGCIDPNAINYNNIATVDNGSCAYNGFAVTFESVDKFVVPAGISSQDELDDLSLNSGDLASLTYDSSMEIVPYGILTLLQPRNLFVGGNQRTTDTFTYSDNLVPCLSYIDTSFKAWVEANIGSSIDVNSYYDNNKRYISSVGMATHSTVDPFELLNVDASSYDVSPTNTALTDSNGYASDLYYGLGDNIAYIKLPASVTDTGLFYDVIVAPGHEGHPTYFPGSMSTISVSESNKDILIPFKFVSLADFNNSASDWYRGGGTSDYIPLKLRGGALNIPAYNYTAIASSANTVIDVAAAGSPNFATPITGGYYIYNTSTIAGVRVLIKSKLATSYVTLTFAAGNGSNGCATTNVIEEGSVYEFTIENPADELLV